MVSERRGMLGVPGSAAVAGRVRVSGLWCGGRALASIAGSVDLLVVSLTVVGDVGYDFREDQNVPQDVVCGRVVRHESEVGSERVGVAAGAWVGELRDGVVDAAQAAPGDGAS